MKLSSLFLFIFNTVPFFAYPYQVAEIYGVTKYVVKYQGGFMLLGGCFAALLYPVAWCVCCWCSWTSWKNGNFRGILNNQVVLAVYILLTVLFLFIVPS